MLFRSELCRDPELRKLGLDSLKFKELAGAKAVKLANAALEAGVGASNVGDPRLKLLTGEDLYAGLRFMETDAKEILTSVLGGVGARGESLIGMLEKHMAQGNSEQELNWTGMMDRILKDSTFLTYQNIGENNVHGGESKRIRPDYAHLYMQLINWSALGKLPPGVGFDPKNDPAPEDPDARDEELKSSFDRVGGFTEGMLKGSIFKSEKHGFFIVFDDPRNKILEGIQNAKLGEGIDGVFRHFIDPAYRVYRRVLETYRNQGISNDNLVLMGYSGGGAIASVLSAALHMGAFTEDSP